MEEFIKYLIENKFKLKTYDISSKNNRFSDKNKNIQKNCLRKFKNSQNP